MYLTIAVALESRHTARPFSYYYYPLSGTVYVPLRRSLPRLILSY